MYGELQFVCVWSFTSEHWAVHQLPVKRAQGVFSHFLEDWKNVTNVNVTNGTAYGKILLILF